MLQFYQSTLIDETLKQQIYNNAIKLKINCYIPHIQIYYIQLYYFISNGEVSIVSEREQEDTNDIESVYLQIMSEAESVMLATYCPRI